MSGMFGRIEVNVTFSPPPGASEQLAAQGLVGTPVTLLRALDNRQRLAAIPLIRQQILADVQFSDAALQRVPPNSPLSDALVDRVAFATALDKSAQLSRFQLEALQPLLVAELNQQAVYETALRQASFDPRVVSLQALEGRRRQLVAQQIDLKDAIGSLFTTSADLAPGTPTRQLVEQRGAILNQLANSLEVQRVQAEVQLNGGLRQLLPFAPLPGVAAPRFDGLRRQFAGFVGLARFIDLDFQRELIRQLGERLTEQLQRPFLRTSFEQSTLEQLSTQTRERDAQARLEQAAIATQFGLATGGRSISQFLASV